jgi:hypothetical protein
LVKALPSLKGNPDWRLLTGVCIFFLTSGNATPTSSAPQELVEPKTNLDRRQSTMLLTLTASDICLQIPMLATGRFEPEEWRNGRRRCVRSLALQEKDPCPENRIAPTGFPKGHVTKPCLCRDAIDQPNTVCAEPRDESKQLERTRSTKIRLVIPGADGKRHSGRRRQLAPARMGGEENQECGEGQPPH